MTYPSINFYLKKGLGIAALYRFTKRKATPEQLKLAANWIPGNWEFRSIPPRIFSTSESVVVRQRRIFAAVLLSNYSILEENSRPIEKQNDNHPSLPRVKQLLCLCYNAHVLTLTNCSHLEEGAALSLNASTRLIQSFLDDLVILTHCPCGRPVLLRVQNYFTPEWNFKRGFFRCPWCNRADKSLKVYMAERLRTSDAYIKFRQEHPYMF